MSLIVQGRPTNLHLPEGARAMPVDGDLYRICERVAEIDPSLYVLVLDQDARYAFAIMERCHDGVDRLIFRVKELDGRVLRKLERIMAVPLQQRLAEIEKVEYKLAEEAKENQLEELWERLGGPMYSQLEHDGFVEHRGKSYPKTGVSQARRRKGVVGH